MSLFIFLQRPPQSFLTNLERGEESKGAQRDDASSGGKTCMDQLVMWKWDKRGRPLRIIQKKTRSCKYMQLWCDRKLHWFLEFFYIKAHVRIQHICTFTQCIVYIFLAVELKSKSFLIDAQNWTFSPLVRLICRRSDDTFITVISGRKQWSREVCDIPADDLSLAVVIRDAPSCPLREAPPSNTTADQRRRRKKNLFICDPHVLTLLLTMTADDHIRPFLQM